MATLHCIAYFLACALFLQDIQAQSKFEYSEESSSSSSKESSAYYKKEVKLVKGKTSYVMGLACNALRAMDADCVVGEVGRRFMGKTVLDIDFEFMYPKIHVSTCTLTLGACINNVYDKIFRSVMKIIESIIANAQEIVRRRPECSQESPSAAPNPAQLDIQAQSNFDYSEESSSSKESSADFKKEVKLMEDKTSYAMGLACSALIVMHEDCIVGEVGRRFMEKIVLDIDFEFMYPKDIQAQSSESERSSGQFNAEIKLMEDKTTYVMGLACSALHVIRVDCVAGEVGRRFLEKDVQAEENSADYSKEVKLVEDKSSYVMGLACSALRIIDVDCEVGDVGRRFMARIVLDISYSFSKMFQEIQTQRSEYNYRESSTSSSSSSSQNEGYNKEVSYVNDKTNAVMMDACGVMKSLNLQCVVGNMKRRFISNIVMQTVMKIIRNLITKVTEVTTSVLRLNPSCPKPPPRANPEVIMVDFSTCFLCCFKPNGRLCG
ncbi:hypothetical protein CBL_02089 [Carabus blaptoides fortunei]